ncbi:MAG: ribosomal RNA small subunit methyltransferase A [Pyrinomonadaceae bacterium]|nr:ribosomal RNA small subunit methyltransferase A [Pyrinomonadaceae bacterium]
MKKRFAKKSFGQNFLTDENVIRKLISAIDPQNDELIIEIGPGRGALTSRIIESEAKLIAIEIERDVIHFLKEEFSTAQNFTLIEGDVLKIEFEKIINNISTSKAKLAANLPYYISTAILQKLIAERHFFSEMILMFQREVADRITAQPSTKDRGFLTVLVEAYFECERLFDVSPTSFQPVPKVWSSVVRLKPKLNPRKDWDEEIFRNLVSTAFMQRRKTLHNNLKNIEGDLESRIGEAGGIESIFNITNFQPDRRAESLSLDEWIRLAEPLMTKNSG